MDLTPLMFEIFKTQAEIKTLSSFLLTKEQKEKFNELYGLNLKDTILEFCEGSPDSVENPFALKEMLEKKFPEV